MAESEFRGGPAYIRFELGWPYEDIPGYLPTTVMVDTGVFRGGCATHTSVDGWQGLCGALAELGAKVATGEVVWALGDEVGVDLIFRQTKVGQLAVLVQLNLHEQDATLRFWVDADQTYLPHWIETIEKALAELPAP